MLSLISHKEVHAHRVLQYSLSYHEDVKALATILRTKESVHRCCTGTITLNRDGNRSEGGEEGGSRDCKFTKLLQLSNCAQCFENIPANNIVQCSGGCVMSLS